MTEYITNPQPPPAVIPAEVEGLPTTGLMGTSPAVTVGSVIAIVSFIVNLLVQYFGVSLPPEVKEFADQYGIMLATLAVPIITGVIIRAKVFSPHSVGEIESGLR